MDRREALKRLGAGTAVAVASPAILPSSRVAAAASGPGTTGLVGVPQSGEPVPFDHIVATGQQRRRRVHIVFNNTAVSCTDGSVPEFSVQWRIASVTFAPERERRRFLIKSGSGTRMATMPLRRRGYSGGSFGPVAYEESFLFRKRYARGERRRTNARIRNRDSYVMEALCRWHCAGASQDVVATYQFAGQGINQPIVTNVSWDETS